MIRFTIEIKGVDYGAAEAADISTNIYAEDSVDIEVEIMNEISKVVEKKLQEILQDADYGISASGDSVDKLSHLFDINQKKGGDRD